MIRTTNSIERLNNEIGTYTIFPNGASNIGLVSILLMEISGEWVIGKYNCTGKSLSC